MFEVAFCKAKQQMENLKQKVVAIIKCNEAKISHAMTKSESQLPLAMKEVETSFSKCQPLIDEIASQIQTYQLMIKSLSDYNPKPEK